MRRTMAALLIFASTSLARADAPIDEARTLFRQGNELRDKDPRAALAKYEAAHALYPTPITGLEVGRMHMQLGELVAARDTFRATLELKAKPNESANIVAARAEAERLATDLEARIPKIIVSVDANEPVHIEIDGVTASQAPKQVDPGKHVIVVRAGTTVRTSEIVITERETRKLEFSITLAPEKKTVAEPPKLAPIPEKEGRPTWVWASLGVAGVGVAVGAVAGALTLHGRSELSSGCADGRCPPDEHDRLTNTRTWATVSTVSFAVAGAAAAVSIVGLLTTSSAPAPSSKQGSLTPTFGLGSVGLRGVF